MASATFPYGSSYDLATFDMAAGSNQALTFSVFTSASAVVNLNAAQITWKLSPFGSNASILTKTQTLSGSSNSFTVNLIPADTVNLSGGKYIQSYEILDISGSAIFPSRGYINLLGAIF